MLTRSLQIHIVKIQCIQHECTHAHTHTDSHTHRLAHTCTHTHSHTHARTHTHTPVAYQGNWGNETEEKVFKKRKVFKEDLKELTGRMADRNRELVPDNWSLVRERALLSRVCSDLALLLCVGFCPHLMVLTTSLPL